MLSILFLVGLHFGVRWQELDHHRATVSKGFYHAAVNFGAGKGFYQDAGFTSSPELKAFHDFAYRDVRKLAERSKWDGLFSSFSDYGDFELRSTDNEKVRTYPVGLRLAIGVLWRLFGFSWAWVIAINYLFSLAALLALVAIGRRLGGPVAGFFSGLLFCLAQPEIYESVTFGRDGMPLWCGIILAWVWIRVVPDVPSSGRLSKPDLVRLALSSVAVGATLWVAAEARSSNVYFVPLSILFALVHAGFLARAAWPDSGARALVRAAGVAAVFCAIFVGTYAGIRGATARVAGVSEEPVSATMHRVYAGLGLFNENRVSPAPNQAQFNDPRIFVKAQEYSNRVLGRQGRIGYLSVEQDEALARCYLDNVQRYPHSIFTGYRKSFQRTLSDLNRPTPFFRLTSPIATTPNAFMQALVDFNKKWYRGDAFPWVALAGLVIVLFRPERFRLALFLVGFAILNAAVSGIQLHPRHVLMGHFVYWAGWGVALGSVVGLVGRVARTVPGAVGRGAESLFDRAPTPEIEWRPGVRRVGFLAAGAALLLGAGWATDLVTNRIQRQNVARVVEDLHSRPAVRSPFVETTPAVPVPAAAGRPRPGDAPTVSRRFFTLEPTIENHDTFELPLYALVVELGRVEAVGVDAGGHQSSLQMTLAIFAGDSPDGTNRYLKSLEIPEGVDVRAVWPIYHARERYSVAVESDVPITAVRWISLADWRGEVWEGLYDAAAIASTSDE